LLSLDIIKQNEIIMVEELEFIGDNEQGRDNAEIRLSFFRHGESERTQGSDFERRLTEKGKKQAAEKSRFVDINQSIAFGSPRKRTQEAAGLVMSGNLDEINGQESLEEIRGKLDKELKIGSKIGIDQRLDCSFQCGSEYERESLEAFSSDNFLKFLVEESDQRASELGDEKSFTYLRGAKAIAGIISKYLKIEPRWNRLVQQKDYSNRLERFLGTHQGVGESFLAKIIEMKKGKEERDNFVEILNGQGFDFTEGFEVVISSAGKQEPKIKINYQKEKNGKIIYQFNEAISNQDLDEIINE
jgi:hypothetical protein